MEADFSEVCSRREGAMVTSCKKGDLFLLATRNNVFTMRVTKQSKRFTSISNPGDVQSLIG